MWSSLPRRGALLAYLAGAATAACALDVDATGAGKACDEGRCSAGYVCDATQRCVADGFVTLPEAGAGGRAPADVPETGGIKVGPTNPPEVTGGSTTGNGGQGGAGGAGSPAPSGGGGAPLIDAGTAPTTRVDGSTDAAPDAAGCALLRRYYPDEDGDGFGRSADARWLCAPPGAAWAAEGGDCDDDDARVFPGQTTYFTASYAHLGAESFDYDCSGREEPDPTTMGLAPDCPALALLVCTGSGFAGTGRRGDGIDGTCGSATLSTCSGLLACTATTSAVAPKGCR